MLTVVMLIGNMLHQGCPLLLLHVSVVSTGGSNPVTVVDRTVCPESDISTIPFLGIGLKFLWNICIYRITKSIKRQTDKLWQLSRRYVIEKYNTFSHMPDIKEVHLVVVFCSHEFLHHSVSVWTWRPASSNRCSPLFSPSSSMWVDPATSLLCKIRIFCYHYIFV